MFICTVSHFTLNINSMLNNCWYIWCVQYTIVYWDVVSKSQYVIDAVVKQVRKAINNKLTNKHEQSSELNVASIYWSWSNMYIHTVCCRLKLGLFWKPIVHPQCSSGSSTEKNTPFTRILQQRVECKCCMRKRICTE